MPPQAAELEEALKKKGGLTLSQLANYDDLITDALVDRIYFWSTIRKLKANYHACRGVQEETVCKIIQDEAVVNKDPATAQEKLLQLPGLAKYHRNLKTADEKEHFVRHLRKYINLYLPDCPFEVGTTNRYTVTTAEASIIARKPIRKGEPIKYLSGIQVEMTEREEQELSSRTDFSIVLSSRRKRPSLFLGPARFANHDCDSNAKLNTTGPHGIHIVARKDIAVGDEITVTYGLDYFGEDNCECLCGTCEALMRNGWDPRGPILNESSDEESDDDDEEEAEEEEKEEEAEEDHDIVSTEHMSGADKKRKREEDDEDEIPTNPPKRGRGRPRKHPRPDDEKPSPSKIVDDDYESCDSSPVTAAAVGNARSYPADMSGLDLDSSTPVSDLDPHLHPRDVVFQNVSRPGGVRADDTVKRIWQLLHDVAERQGRFSEMSDFEQTPITSIPQSGLDTPQSDVDRGTELGEDLFMASVSNFLTPDRGPSKDSGKAVTMESNPDSDGNSAPRHRLGESLTSRLPTIRKERSFSRLRNVINADDARDPFSIPVSPVPQSEPPKRKRGRPRKNALPDKEVAERHSSSPSSAGNDSASYASVASSATSLDVFAAGSIAENICEMFTSNVKSEEELAEDATVSEPPRRVSSRNGPKAQLDDKSKDELENKSVDMSKKPGDDWVSPRRSRRSGMNEVSTPAAVRSIEKTDDAVKTEDDVANNSHDDGEEEEGEQGEEEEAAEGDGVKRGPVRTPGDYTLCRILLTTPYHRWVECRNCDEFFVQGDAYLTRIACPRCERHSKLYGYHWPKTDREGKFDKDERILDHRMIHRFIDPEEERSERKGRRTLASVLKEKELSERQESLESDRGDKRLRSSPRRSESRRKLRSA